MSVLELGLGIALAPFIQFIIVLIGIVVIGTILFTGLVVFSVIYEKVQSIKTKIESFRKGERQ